MEATGRSGLKAEREKYHTEIDALLQETVLKLEKTSRKREKDYEQMQ